MDQDIEYLKLPIIVDIGSGEVKAGFSGEEKPKVIFQNYFGEGKYKKILRPFNKENNAELNEIFIGEECNKYFGAIKLSYPVSHGVFSNDQDILTIFNYIYNQLGFNSQEIKEHPILITEPLLNPYDNKEKIATALFENLNVPALFFASQPILSLFSTSKTSGTVLESGFGITQSCVIYEGYSAPCSYERYNYGGGEVTEFLRSLLQRKGYHFYNSTEFLIVNDIKEKACYCTQSLEIEKKLKNSSLDYVLPDGSVVKLDEEKEMATEILFDPLLMGKEYLGLQKMIQSSVNKVDMQLRNNSYGNILLTGGNTCFKGLAEKLCSELKKLNNPNINIKITNSANPKSSCWIGGNIISTLEVFRKMWVTKKDWLEKGTKVIHVKTL